MANTFVLYHYTPSLAAAVIFIVLFALGAIAHIWLAARYRSRYFIAFIIGCIFELVGYVGRALGHFQSDSLNPYVMQSLLILVAPALFAATIYMVLGRLIRALQAEQHSLIPLKWLTKVFVIGDVISFFVQGAGGGLMSAATSSSYSTGRGIIIAGLIIQIVIFGFFIVVAVIFHVRINKRPTTLSVNKTLVPWQKHMTVLYVASFIILVRNLVRVVEYAQGNDGFIISHEVFLYIFDAALIFSVVILFAIIHPGQLLGNGKTEHFGTQISDSETVMADVVGHRYSA